MRWIKYLLLAVVALLMGGCSDIPLKERKVERYELVAVKTKASVEGRLTGSFFLLFGGINGRMTEEEYCAFYYKDNDGAIIYQKFKMDQIRIYEDAPDKPYVNIHVCWVTKRLFDGYGGSTAAPIGTRLRVVEYARLHVPPNSVTTAIQIGLP